MDHEQVAKGLRARLEKLEQTIVHADVKDHFLSFAKKNLDELERSWIQHGPQHIADVMLPLIEEQVARAEVKWRSTAQPYESSQVRLVMRWG